MLILAGIQFAQQILNRTGDGHDGKPVLRIRVPEKGGTRDIIALAEQGQPIHQQLPGGRGRQRDTIG